MVARDFLLAAMDEGVPCGFVGIPAGLPASGGDHIAVGVALRERVLKSAKRGQVLERAVVFNVVRNAHAATRD